ncbi:signal transduction histidine kinase [Frankia sp. EI5c]|nr:signal transduction histidine kinase [Frankia sp. EI5c]
MTWRSRVRRAALVAVADALPALVFGVILLVGTSNIAREQVPPAHPLDTTAYALLVLAGGAIAVRRYAPLLLLAAEMSIISTYTALGYPHGPANLAVAVAVFTVGLRLAPRTASRAGPACAVILTSAAAVSYARGYVDGGWRLVSVLLGDLLLILVPVLLGALLRLSRVASARAEEEETRRRIEQMRLRMAREVHDVVGHGLSVISLHAAVALHVLDRRPEQAQVALEAIRRTSVDALNELRATLALTRAGSEHADTLAAGAVPVAGDARDSSPPAAAAPQERPGAPRMPLTGLSRLPGLIAEVRLCGTAVDLVTDGELTELPAEVDLAAYRIVQEALTNVLRHAGPAEVRVALTAAGDHLRVEIVDSPVAGPGTPVTGHGLRGLRERVAELGGTLTAGPCPQGGWRVRSDLPIGATAALPDPAGAAR